MYVSTDIDATLEIDGKSYPLTVCISGTLGAGGEITDMNIDSPNVLKLRSILDAWDFKERLENDTKDEQRARASEEAI